MIFLLAAGWAFAEAILFVIVADVPISYVAVRHGWRAGIAAAVVAALASGIGGLAAYAWAASDPAGVRAAMVALPAIDAAMIAEAQSRFAAGGYAAMFWASLSGVPYKLYALAAGAGGAAVMPFLLLSPLVRLPRFLFAALGSAALGHFLSGRIAMRGRLAILAGFWVVFYAWYFSVMPA